MRILLINQTFYPDLSATSQYLTDIAVALVKEGYKVDVISDRRSYDDRRKILPKIERHKGVRIFRVGSTAFGKKTKFHRGLDYLTFNLNLLIKISFFPQYDIVIGLTTPPWISFFGMLFSKFKGGRFIHWAMDVNPDQAARLGWVKQGSLFYKLLNAWARLTYKKSYRIIALDKYIADLIKSKGIDEHKVYVIPLWSQDDIEFIPPEKNPFRRVHNLENKFVVMYSGNFSICHPIATLLESARRLKEVEDIVFMFIGGGVRLPEILEFKKRYNLDNIIYLPYQNRADIKYSLSAADLHIVSMGDEYVGIVHPSKIYGILNTGRPFVLLGPIKSPIGDIINEYKIGYQVEHGDVESLLKIIEGIKNLTPAEKLTQSMISISLVKTTFSQRTIMTKFLTLLNNS